MADLSKKFSSSADDKPFGYLRECSVEDFFESQYQQSSYSDLNDEQKNRCIREAIDNRRSDIIDIVIAEGLPKPETHATTYVMRSMNTNAYDIARQFIANKDIVAKIDQNVLMRHQLVFCNEVDVIKDLFKAGLRFPPYTEMPYEKLSKDIKNIGKHGQPEVIEYFQEYQPDIFNCPAFLITLCAGAVGRNDTDMLDALEENFFDKFDYEKMVERAVEQFKTKPKALEWLFERRERAHDVEVKWFQDLNLSEEEAKVMRETVVMMGGQDNPDIFTARGMFSYALRNRQYEAAECLVNKSDLSPEQASTWLEDLCKATGIKNIENGLHYITRALLTYGANPFAHDAALIKIGARYNLNVLMTVLSFADSREDLKPHFNVLLENAYLGRHYGATSYIDDNYADVKEEWWDGSALNAAYSTNIKDFLAHALRMETPENKEAYLKSKLDELLPFLMVGPSSKSTVDMALWMAKNIEKPDVTLDMISAAFSTDFKTQGDDALLPHCYESKVKGFEAMAVLLQNPNRTPLCHTRKVLMLEAAKEGMRYDTNPEDIKACVEASDHRGRMLTATMSTAAANGRKDIIQMLRDDFGASFFHVDWAMAERPTETAALEDFRAKNMGLINDDWRTKAPTYNSLDAEGTSDKSAWFARDEKGLTPLKRLSYRPQFIDVLAKFEAKTGARFTVDELLETPPFKKDEGIMGKGYSPFATMYRLQNHVAFMNHPYWNQDIDGLKRLYEELPPYAKRDLGPEFSVKLHSRQARKRAKRPRLG